MKNDLTQVIEMLTVIRDGSFDEVEALVDNKFQVKRLVKECAEDNQQLFEQLMFAHALQQAEDILDTVARNASKTIADACPDDVVQMAKTVRAIPDHVTQVMLTDRYRQLGRKKTND